MYESVKKLVALILAISVTIFTLIAILGIWDVFNKDVIGKSLSTMGVLVFSCSITLIIMKIIEDKNQEPPSQLNQ
jgi:hypothetical protein